MNHLFLIPLLGLRLRLSLCTHMLQYATVNCVHLLLLLSCELAMLGYKWTILSFAAEWQKLFSHRLFTKALGRNYFRENFSNFGFPRIAYAFLFRKFKKKQIKTVIFCENTKKEYFRTHSTSHPHNSCLVLPNAFHHLSKSSPSLCQLKGIIYQTKIKIPVQYKLTRTCFVP